MNAIITAYTIKRSLIPFFFLNILSIYDNGPFVTLRGAVGSKLGCSFSLYAVLCVFWPAGHDH